MMKFALIAIVMATLGLAGSAEAAKYNKKKAIKTVSKKSRASQLPGSQLPTRVEITQPVSSASPVVSPAQTSSAPIATTVDSSEPKRWGLLVDIWAEGQVHGMNRADDRAGLAAEGAEGSETMQNFIHVRPSYKITDTASVAMGVDTEHSFGSKAGGDSGKFIVYDTFVQVAHSKLVTAGPLTIKGYFRPYLPTSEASQDAVRGRYTLLRAGMTAQVPIGAGFDFSYNIEPRYYFQKNLAYRDDKGAWKNTTQAWFKHWIGLGFEAGKFSAYQNLGILSQYFNQDVDEETGQTLWKSQNDNLYAELGFGYQIHENFGVNTGLYTAYSNNIRSPNFQFYNDKEYSYFLEGVVTF